MLKKVVGEQPLLKVNDYLKPNKVEGKSILNALKKYGQRYTEVNGIFSERKRRRKQA